MLRVLLAASCLALPPHYASVEVRPLNPYVIFAPEQFSRASYAYDGTYEFIGTSAGLYKTLSIAALNFDRPLSSQINNVTVKDGTQIYVLLQGGDSLGPTPLNHTILRSTDSANTFTPLDAGLQECHDGYCRYLAATQIDFAPGRIFIAAGGNLLVSDDNGTTWKQLYPYPASGSPATQVCPITFGRFDKQIVIAGECPLDQGFISVGTLRDDMLDWAGGAAPRRLTTPLEIPDLENRNAQFIQKIGEDIFIGVEGGLLKSCDAAQTFHYVLKYPLTGNRYPYIQQFLAPVKYENMRIIAGFDKATLGPYLAWSADGGESWTDASSLLPPNSSVALLTERRDSLPMIFVQQGANITMAQLVISNQPARRRAVRR